MSGNNIPQTIHLIRKERQIQEKYLPYYNRMVSLHPEWTILSYDDNAMDNIVSRECPEFLEQFRAFPKAIQRSDLFRMIILYLKGGFYLDMDIYCLAPLDTLNPYHLVLGEEKTLTAVEMLKPEHKHPLRIGNYMLGSIAGHSFLRGFIEAALSHSGTSVGLEEDVLETTGPGHLTNYYHENKHLHADIHLLQNVTNRCLRRCTAQPSCHFGHYAAHMHCGSWRWQ